MVASSSLPASARRTPQLQAKCRHGALVQLYTSHGRPPAPAPALQAHAPTKHASSGGHRQAASCGPQHLHAAPSRRAPKSTPHRHPCGSPPIHSSRKLKKAGSSWIAEMLTAPARSATSLISCRRAGLPLPPPASSMARLSADGRSRLLPQLRQYVQQHVLLAQPAASPPALRPVATAAGGSRHSALPATRTERNAPPAVVVWRLCARLCARPPTQRRAHSGPWQYAQAQTRVCMRARVCALPGGETSRGNRLSRKAKSWWGGCPGPLGCQANRAMSLRT